ncbi:glucose-1-phosphate thymidylyltransferase [Sporanaerobium hydrogeniformans]|uniref:Glucose-1-phosphate thymidylyltransferase n=1 Tax=Sporanaerobium hydrogeniformans TaxID=3072179 RepID=A0AC61DC75_9FIRM|nr:glucose-1-phosphate thymidylyltransferase RfbA [Sporanaerobium hydrogeniformans]PHV70884.1 glucose-1-phosphate thymidylyltransferase [Sporanaerobium hydrogeniformans]
MKGILLAGGMGSRLLPLTQSLSKQILPIYDKPMIYYPLSTLMLAGIRDILIISSERDIKGFKALLGDGKCYGLSISYKVQSSPRGIAEAFIIGESFIGQEAVSLILGDNIFYGDDFEKTLEKVMRDQEGATIFGYKVENPEAFGVVSFNKEGKVTALEEKPKNPKSCYAVPGLYFYTPDVVQIAKSLKPSLRGELEITDVNKVYLNQNHLRVECLDKKVVWLDTGTPEALLKAANFVEMVQKMQGVAIGCIEEVAYKKGFITKSQLVALAEKMGRNQYGNYLRGLLEG